MKSIEEICNEYNITNYTINGDIVDVNGNVNLSDKGLTKLPLNFGSVSGYFDCSYNNLTDLKGSPKSVSLYFYCSNNNLTDLKESPKSVGGSFNCSNNKLTTLLGSPENIGDGFYCLDNPIGSIFNNVDIDFIRAFNIFKVIKGGKVNLKRLKYVMEMFDKPINIEKIKQYYEIY